MTNKQLLDILADAIEIGLEFLPDSSYYGDGKQDGISWVWEECNSEEQEAVKGARGKMNKAHLAYLEYIKKISKQKIPQVDPSQFQIIGEV